DEIRRAGVRFDFVDGEDVWVIQRGDSAGFLLETLEAFGFVGDRRREDFEGDAAARARVARFVDFAHAARADQRDDFVGPKFSTSGEWQGPRIIPLRAGPDTPVKSTTPCSARQCNPLRP